MNDGGSLIVKSKRWLRLLPMFQFLVMVADLATTLQLTRMTFSAYGTSWTKDLNSGNFNLIFEKFAADLLGACILRLAVFPLFTHLGIKFGSTTTAATAAMLLLPHTKICLTNSLSDSTSSTG